MRGRKDTHHRFRTEVHWLVQVLTLIVSLLVLAFLSQASSEDASSLASLSRLDNALLSPLLCSRFWRLAPDILRTHTTGRGTMLPSHWRLLMLLRLKRQLNITCVKLSVKLGL